MTGGKVVILGEVGDNFGAGMTGGMAFIYDEAGTFESRVNPESLQLGRIAHRIGKRCYAIWLPSTP